MPPDPARRRPAHRRAPGWMAVSRGAALGVAILAGLSCLESYVYSTSPFSNWLCSFSPLTQQAGMVVLAMTSISLLMFAMRPALPGPVWLVAVGTVLLLSGFCVKEILQIEKVVPDAQRTAAMARPLGVIVLLAVSAIGVFLGNAERARGRSSFFGIVLSMALAVIGFAIISVQTGGLPDLPPDFKAAAILVMSVPPDNSGNTQESLEDRGRTGCRLLKERRGSILLLSVCDGDGAAAATETMKRLVSEAGTIDGNDVRYPVIADSKSLWSLVVALPKVESDRRIIIVSHWYELARLRILARRAGLAAVAVPADQQHALFNQNRLVALEAVSLLRCFCEPAIAFARQFLQPANPQPQNAGLIFR